MKTKQRTLAVLLVLVLVLGGLLWFVSRSNAAEEAASSAAAEGSILLSSFAAGDVTSIRYAYGGETLTLNYDSGSPSRWTMRTAAGRWRMTRTIIWMHLPAIPWSRRWHP